MGYVTYIYLLYSGVLPYWPYIREYKKYVSLHNRPITQIVATGNVTSSVLEILIKIRIVQVNSKHFDSI